jgi:hypothetical protein
MFHSHHNQYVKSLNFTKIHNQYFNHNTCKLIRLWDLRFSQQCRWRIKSPALLRHAEAWVVPDIMYDQTDSIKLQQSKCPILLELLDTEDKGNDPSGHWELLTHRQHQVTFQKDQIFSNTTVRTSNLTASTIWTLQCPMFNLNFPNSIHELPLSSLY